MTILRILIGAALCSQLITAAVAGDIRDKEAALVIHLDQDFRMTRVFDRDGNELKAMRNLGEDSMLPEGETGEVVGQTGIVVNQVETPSGQIYYCPHDQVWSNYICATAEEVGKNLIIHLNTNGTMIRVAGSDGTRLAPPFHNLEDTAFPLGNITKQGGVVMTVFRTETGALRCCEHDQTFSNIICY